jgi:hypothetical protein
MEPIMSISPPELKPRMPLMAVVVTFGLAWLALNGAILALARGFLPFDRPNLAGQPFWLQMAMPSLGVIEQLGLMGMVALLSRGRPVTEIGERAPPARTAGRETALVLIYAMLAQAGGWIVGPALGFRPFSFHLAGTLVGCSILASPGEAMVWAGYNFLAFAVIPYLWFRRRYSNRELCLVFDRRGRDLTVLLIVLVVESAVELAAMPGVFSLPLPVFLRAAPLAFGLFLVGTVLPTMITIYAILVPRYYKLTGSVAISTILGGLTYAAMHLVEGWSSFRSLSDTVLSLLFVILSYTGPGMFKSFVTLRTSNAWVHALGYHVVAPHTLADAPMIAKVFGLD